MIYRSNKWKVSTDEVVKFPDGQKIPAILVENKSDLLDQNEVGNVVSLKGFANTNNYIGSFRTSAKTGYNINESMEFLIEKIIERLSRSGSNEFTPDEKSISLNPQNHSMSNSIRMEKEKKRNGCC